MKLLTSAVLIASMSVVGCASTKTDTIMPDSAFKTGGYRTMHGTSQSLFTTNAYKNAVRGAKRVCDIRGGMGGYIRDEVISTDIYGSDVSIRFYCKNDLL